MVVLNSPLNYKLGNREGLLLIWFPADYQTEQKKTWYIHV